MAPGPPVNQLTPLPVTWTVDNLTLGAVDDDDCWWIVRSSDGWYGAPKPKTQRVVRANAPGSFRAASFRGERIISLTGATKCPDAVAREAAADRLAACAADPSQLYDLTVTGRTGQSRVIGVELDAKTDVKWARDPRWFDWQLQFACPDPLKYDATWQAPRSTMLDAGTPGVSWGTGGVTFGTGGIDWGQPGTNLISQVANFGTARTFPVFQIDGPVQNPRVTDLTIGSHVDYAGQLYDGDTLIINCGEFPVKLPGQADPYGFPARSIFLNTYTDQRVLLSVPQLWPSVGAGEVHNYQLSGSGLSAAVLTVFMRSAWT